jgi:hypothetical protein
LELREEGIKAEFSAGVEGRRSVEIKGEYREWKGVVESLKLWMLPMQEIHQVGAS